MKKDTSSELALLATSFNNTVKNELVTLDSIQPVKQTKQLELSNTEIQSISALASTTIDSNPELTDEQIAAQLLVKIKDNYPNTFIGKLAKTMVKNKWGARHGG